MTCRAADFEKYNMDIRRDDPKESEIKKPIAPKDTATSENKSTKNGAKSGVQKEVKNEDKIHGKSEHETENHHKNLKTNGGSQRPTLEDVQTRTRKLSKIPEFDDDSQSSTESDESKFSNAS